MTRVIILLIIESYLLLRPSRATSECNGSQHNFSSCNLDMGGAS